MCHDADPQTQQTGRPSGTIRAGRQEEQQEQDWILYLGYHTVMFVPNTKSSRLPKQEIRLECSLEDGLGTQSVEELASSDRSDASPVSLSKGVRRDVHRWTILALSPWHGGRK
jgi:hypothetical protein